MIISKESIVIRESFHNSDARERSENWLDFNVITLSSIKTKTFTSFSLEKCTRLNWRDYKVVTSLERFLANDKNFKSKHSSLIKNLQFTTFKIYVQFSLAL